jgi:hypothetical protein
MDVVRNKESNNTITLPINTASIFSVRSTAKIVTETLTEDWYKACLHSSNKK